jgi:hypothetical protein
MLTSLTPRAAQCPLHFNLVFLFRCHHLCSPRRRLRLCRPTLRAAGPPPSSLELCWPLLTLVPPGPESAPTMRRPMPANILPIAGHYRPAPDSAPPPAGSACHSALRADLTGLCLHRPPLAGRRPPSRHQGWFFLKKIVSNLIKFGWNLTMLE